eukprot:14374716-Alexandrium_andersonii.AAC.1
MFQRAAECSRVFQRAPECALQRAPECKLQSAPECCRVLQSAAECCRVLQLSLIHISEPTRLALI